jgi:hypothetical protein
MRAGLLFIPTTIFDMIWAVRYLQEAHGLEYGDAVLRSAMVPMGWISRTSIHGIPWHGNWRYPFSQFHIQCVVGSGFRLGSAACFWRR